MRLTEAWRLWDPRGASMAELLRGRASFQGSKHMHVAGFSAPYAGPRPWLACELPAHACTLFCCGLSCADAALLVEVCVTPEVSLVVVLAGFWCFGVLGWVSACSGRVHAVFAGTAGRCCLQGMCTADAS
jgi:hypothetical protein